MKIKFTKIFAAVLCLSLMLTGVTGFAAQKTEKQSFAKEIDTLNQLGVLDVTAENASLTKQTVINGMNAIMGNNAPQMVYFEKHEPTDSLNYGQAVMVLVDALGYANYVEMLGFDPGKAESYISTAKRIKLVSGKGKSADDLVTIGEWADLLFEALTKIPLMRPMLYRQSIVYDIDDDSTMLKEYMGIEVLEGVVKGVDAVSIVASDAAGEKSIRLDNVWYNHSFDKDMYKYLGYYAAGYIKTDTKQLCAISVIDRENEVVSVNAEDIKKASSKTALTYYVDDRAKTLKISTEADFIYNRELVTDFTAADLNIEDCDYTFIDNNDDGKADIIIANKYTSFVVGSRQIAEKRILDTTGTLVEMEKFFKDSGVIHDENGEVFAFEDLQSYDVISYLKTRSGKMSYVVAVDKKLEAVYNGSRESGKYIKLDGVEHKTTEDYRKSDKLDSVKIGDVVMAFIDAKGSIADMRYITKSQKAAYLMQAAQGMFDTVILKILDEDSKVKVVEISDSVMLNDRQVNAGELLIQPELLVKGAFAPQLVKYKQNKNGTITAIDTAKNVNKLGHRGNDEFTLNFEGSLTVLSYKPNADTSAVTIAGSKYPLVEDAKVFIISTETTSGAYREEECIVQSAKAVPTNQNPNLKLYNVNENYEPEYVVMTTSWEHNEWVDNWGQAYMIDEIAEGLDEFGEPVYQIKIMNSEGNSDIWYASRGDLITSGGDGWSASWSPDQNDWTVQLKDLPKGSLLHAQRNALDLVGIAVHHIPKEKNQYFEKQSGKLDEFGLSEYVFNGTYTMCYGKVLRKTDVGYIINCHEPTDDEKAAGAVYPMPEWNRHMPMSPTQTVVIFDKEKDVAYRDVAGNIVPGDEIFIKRDKSTYNGIYVYR